MRREPVVRHERTTAIMLEPYGQVFFPRDVSIEAADLNSAWGVFADELDVESVVRYTISAGGGE